MDNRSRLVQSSLIGTTTKCRWSVGPQVITVTIPQLTSGGGTKHWSIKTIPNTDEWEMWGNNCGTEVGTGEFTSIFDFSHDLLLQTDGDDQRHLHDRYLFVDLLPGELKI